jgi:hypothetical protein
MADGRRLVIWLPPLPEWPTLSVWYAGPSVAPPKPSAATVPPPT